MSEKDTLYRDASIQADDFVFDQRVVRVFPDMIRRSVPGYGVIVPSIALLARRYAQPGTNIYDLGCSLGAVTFAIRDALATTDIRLIAIDNSPDMVARIRQTAAERVDGEEQANISIVEADILDSTIENASVVVMNFTLQFIEPGKRTELLKRIAAGMRPGGVLVLSEKIRFGDPDEGGLQDSWHLDFKRAQGYSELEIARKRDALERTLQPDTLEQHLDRLLEAGFRAAYRWFQCFSFVSVVAFR
jgi:tRNA (cmo5U34)-methyltransferase